MRSPGATVRKRLVLLMGGFFLLFLCVCARLVDVQIVRQKELTARGVKQWTRSGVVAARRGDIVDTNGRLLAQSVTSFILTARPRDVKDAGALAKVLARELGLDEETILKKLSGSKAASVTLARQLSREDADRLRAIRQNGNSPDAEALIGITFDEDASRWYPMGTLLAQTLGLCNVDGEGQSGLELQYNDVLAGKPGKMITEVDARARTLPDGVTLYVPAEQGNTLRLTIDRDVQAAVERAVRECAQVNDAVSVQAIAMDVNTGALLAMAMYPTYDPANPPRDDLDRLNELMRLTVLSDVYEPGSTFKMLTAAAAIDCGATSPQEGFYCSGRITVDGSTVRCWGAPHGAETMARALENSCNQSFIQIGARLGKQAFCDYFAAFGLREPTGIDLPAEPKKSLYYTADRMGPVELASCAFGQSSKISYLEMAAAVCAVVNGGKLMQPYVVSEILAPDGSTIEQLSPVCKRQVLKAETSQTMREMMEAVVLYGGGRNAQIAGYRVGGKSGTSQKLDSADEKARIASFVAVAPIDDPQFLCLVCLDEPHSWTTAGGSLSAPVCAEVLKQTLVYKGVPRAADSGSADAQAAALPADGDSFDGA